MFFKIEACFVTLICFCCVVHGYSDCGKFNLILKCDIFVDITHCLKTASENNLCAFSGSEVGSIENIQIPGCDNEERCVFKRGTNATINIDFKISEYNLIFIYKVIFLSFLHS